MALVGGKHEGKTILPYSFIDTEKTDSQGNPIYYSTVDVQYINSDKYYSMLMYNGKWKLYNSILTSTGQKNQLFELTGLLSDADSKRFVVWPYIHVYAKHMTDDGSFTMTKYSPVTDGLFTDANIQNGATIYSSLDQVFNVRLTENKVYTITFGNGTTGKIPPAGDQLYVFYMEGNGDGGEIDPEAVKNAVLKHSAGDLGVSQDIYDAMFSDYSSSAIALATDSVEMTNTTKSTAAVPEETVESIRQNAPEWFKTGNRLVTQADYTYYVKNRFRDNILDVACQNNWEYISTFYRWLWNLGKIKHNDGNFYINQDRLVKYDYKYADAADCNNVYMWIKMRNDADIYTNVIEKEIAPIKSMTADVVFIKPVDVAFAICGNTTNATVNDIVTKNSYIEVLLDTGSLYSNESIQKNIATIIQSYFKEENFTLGSTINLNAMTDEIMKINGVLRLRTVYKSGLTTSIVNGLSFGSWSTTSLINAGDDLEVSTMNRTLEKFQFPMLYDSDISSLSQQIKVIRESIGGTTTSEF